VDIFSKEMVFFPINVENIVTLKGEHWVLCVVYMKKKQIVFFDSLGQSGSPYMVNIMQYLRDEMQSTKKVKLNDKDWKFLNP
jgi:Ulp1 family protease